jgi:hypothetical protein
MTRKKAAATKPKTKTFTLKIAGSHCHISYAPLQRVEKGDSVVFRPTKDCIIQFKRPGVFQGNVGQLHPVKRGGRLRLTFAHMSPGAGITVFSPLDIYMSTSRGDPKPFP